MTDLADFLLTRFAEDEATARAATPGPWSVDNPHYAEAIYAGDGYTTVVAGGRWGGEASAFESTEDALHIARWDPARVLAECGAKRRIVEDALADVRDARRRPGWTIPDDQVGEKGRDYRTGYENARAHLLPDTLDRTERLLRMLALPYADHPDYRPEWRP